MLNSVYQLVASHSVAVYLQEIPMYSRVLVRPTYMSICQADQRYFQGKRPDSVMRQKLPMALIHEAVGSVVWDYTGNFSVGTPVAMIPNESGPAKPEIYSNYGSGFKFHSSGTDGFMQEIVSLPAEQLVTINNLEPVMALSEMCSVAFHALDRFEKIAHSHRQRIAIWGDGSVGYILATVLKYVHPEYEITVVGKHASKLNYFSFVDNRLLLDSLSSNITFDHVFECTGGAAAETALSQIISHISPQGTVILMGVSENPVAIPTRLVLEKGITMVGSSRSNRNDFIQAAKIFNNGEIRKQLSRIIYIAQPVRSIDDIYERFNEDLAVPFKTVFEWRI